MKNLLITLIITLLLTNYSCAQQTTMKSISDAKKIEINKKEFIGKPLSYFLSHINMEIKSIIPAPNKKLNEVNRISFLFVTHNQYRNSNKDISHKPTRLTVVFNQNADLLGESCRYDIKGCTEWTKQDEKNLGDLIIYDIYMSGIN